MQELVAVMLQLYQVQVARSEHFEQQRSAVSNLVLALGGGALTLAFFDGRLTSLDRPVDGIMLLLGVYGMVAVLQHSKRAQRHGRRAAGYRELLHELVPEARIEDVRADVRERLGGGRTFLNHIWVGPPLFITMIGIVLLVLA